MAGNDHPLALPLFISLVSKDPRRPVFVVASGQQSVPNSRALLGSRLILTPACTAMVTVDMEMTMAMLSKARDCLRCLPINRAAAQSVMIVTKKPNPNNTAP